MATIEIVFSWPDVNDYKYGTPSDSFLARWMHTHWHHLTDVHEYNESCVDSQLGRFFRVRQMFYLAKFFVSRLGKHGKLGEYRWVKCMYSQKKMDAREHSGFFGHFLRESLLRVNN